MACYLCAYVASETPYRLEPLPVGSPATAADDLGTCTECGVWACSQHGTRYGAFECAICTSSAAVVAATTTAGPPPDADAADGPGPADYDARSGRADVVLARTLGNAATDGQQKRGWEVAERIVGHHADMRGLHDNGAEADSMGGNVVADFSAVLRDRLSARSLEFADAAGEQDLVGVDGLLIDALGGALRERFAPRRPAPLADAGIVVTGALLFAMNVADGPEDDERVRAVEQIRVRAPWEVRRPALLDPVMWLVATLWDEGGDRGD
jgi:hypothetical protein